jgi:trans-2,3-dihydro-3-hydroxyanthranilate isomerase
MKVPVALVDAFTRTAGQGNRAGVVVNPPPLDNAGRLAVARAIAASETAFVEVRDGGASLWLRYFTPTTEVPFCGHATVATFRYLADLGRLAWPGFFSFECGAGRHDVEVERAEDGIRVWLTTPHFPWTENPVATESLMRILGGTTRMLDTGLPIQQAGPKLFVPIASRQDLFALQPRWEELIGIGLNVFAFTTDVIEPDSIAHGRFFAPKEGIREDPVTGAANGPLAVYLTNNGVIRLPRSGGVVRVRAEQGDAIGKPGRVDLEITGAGTKIERVRIGGLATMVLTGDVHLDP